MTKRKAQCPICGETCWSGRMVYHFIKRHKGQANVYLSPSNRLIKSEVRPSEKNVLRESHVSLKTSNGTGNVDEPLGPGVTKAEATEATKLVVPNSDLRKAN